MSQAIVRSDLESKLLAWAATHSPTVKIALQNVPFIKPADYSPFVEEFLIPAYTVNASLDGSRQRYLGIFQLNIWTKDGIGSGTAERILASLEQHFPVIPKTGLVSVEQTPSAGRAIQQEGWEITPVMIKYRYEA